MTDNLNKKITKAVEIIKKINLKYPPEKVAVAWTGGKDSTVLLHLVQKALNGKIHFPVFFNDSTMEFPEVYQFIEKLTGDWNLNLTVFKHSKKELKNFAQATKEEQKRLSREMKVNSIKRALQKYQFAVFMAAIRWDEHQARAREKHFSPRKGHLRVHPILQFTEKDIWDYINKERVPYVSLYDQGYRSLGETPFTQKAKIGQGERSGREYDKEQAMQKLRALGYW